MAKPLRTLQKQFLQQGLHLLFSFDTTIAPGVIIERRRARDVNRKGSIDKFKGAKLKVLGPADLGLMEFSRVHELDVGAGAELIGGAAASNLKKARTVNLSLGAIAPEIPAASPGPLCACGPPRRSSGHLTINRV